MLGVGSRWWIGPDLGAGPWWCDAASHGCMCSSEIWKAGGPADLPPYNPFRPSLCWWRKHLNRFRRGGKKGEGRKTVSFPLTIKKWKGFGRICYLGENVFQLLACPPPLTSPVRHLGVVAPWCAYAHCDIPLNKPLKKKKGKKNLRTSYCAKRNQKIQVCMGISLGQCGESCRVTACPFLLSEGPSPTLPTGPE